MSAESNSEKSVSYQKEDERPCVPILLVVWQRQRPWGLFSRDTRRITTLSLYSSEGEEDLKIEDGDAEVVADEDEVDTLNDEENNVYDMAQTWMVESMSEENDITVEQVC